jgi:type IV pilus assembly protein PilQ
VDLKWRALCIATGVAATTPAFGRNDTQALNKISAVNVEATSSGRVVDIACEKEPVFTVFRLADPVRIVIDVARGDVSKLDGPIEIDDGVLGDIAVAQFSDDRNALGRLIIGLDKAFDYEVKQNGTHVRVAVRGDASTAVATTKNNKKAEQAKAEQAKIAAADKAAADKKAEDAKVALAKIEAAKIEAAKLETAKQETQRQELAKRAKNEEQKLAEAKAQQEKLALQRMAQEKKEQERKAQELKAEEARQLLAKQEAAKQETAKAEAAKVAAAKPQAPAPASWLEPAPEKSVHELQATVVDKLMERVQVKRSKDSSEVLIAIKGGKPAYEILELEDPPRVVFDFLGVATKLPKSSQWSLGTVGKLRLGIHHDKIRLVLDGIGHLPHYEVDVKDGQIRIATEMRKPAPEAIAKVEDGKPEVVPSTPAAPNAPAIVAKVVEAKPPEAKPLETKPAATKPLETKVAETKVPETKVVEAPKALTKVEPAKVEIAKTEPVKATPAKPEPAPVELAKADTKSKAGLSMVQALDVKKVDERAHIRFAAPTNAVYEVDHSIDRAPSLSISGVSLTKDLERSTDVSKMGTGLIRLTSFNERKGKGGVRIIANLAAPLDDRVYRDGEEIVWEFDLKQKSQSTGLVAVAPESSRSAPLTLPAPTPPASVKVSMQPLPEVAGFASDATNLLRASTLQAPSGGRRINLEMRSADLLNVLRYISEVSGENIIAGDDVTGKITLHLRNVTWEQALDAVLQTKGYGRVRQGGIIRVAPVKKLQEEKEQELARKKAEEQVAPTYVRLIPINYAQAKDVIEQLKPLLTKDRGKATFDERTNTIVAEDLADVLAKMENLAHRLDTQTPQVLIESRIVEANTQHVRDIGIQWGGSNLFSAATGNATGLAFPSLLGFAGGSDDAQTISTGTANPPRYAVNLPAPVGTGGGGSMGFIFGNAANTALLSLRLSALENNGSVRIVSAPKVTTLDNVKARISQGVSIPISVTSAAGVNTRFIDAFLELEVRPHVTQDGSIMMEIKASKNEPDFSRTGAQGDPTIQKKVAETQVLVKDGDTTVIGGIYTRNTTVNYNEVPFLSKIPVLGWLFKRKREQDDRAELLVFITPRIVNRQLSSVQGGGGL